MILRALEKELYLRLGEDDMTLVCTVRFGGLCVKVTEFPVEPALRVSEDNQEDLVRVRNRFRTPDNLR